MESKLTCVSGYWIIKNKHGNQFNDWFKTTLRINCPYIFFGDKQSIELVKKYRNDLTTYYIELNIEDFITYQYKNKMITHPYHCPSTELNLIWNEKIYMIQKAFNLNPFQSDYFCWIDAGICTYRNKYPPNQPFPNLEKLNKLPTDKFIFSSSCNFNSNRFIKGQYHLHHFISGTSYILHKNIIDKFINLYNEYLKLIDKNYIYTDQVILTLIYKNNKDLFFKYIDGYGEIITSMF